MGHQQLLYIALGIVLVGLAIFVGINIFSSSSEEATINTMILEGTTIGHAAQNYYIKPPGSGGGGKSFIGFVIPTKLANTETAIYVIQSVAQSQIVIKGTPKSPVYTKNDSNRKIYSASVGLGGAFKFAGGGGPPDYSFIIQTTVTPTDVTSEVIY